MDEISEPESELVSIRRRLDELRQRVVEVERRAERLELRDVRVRGVLVLALLGAGMVLPIWHEEIDGKPTTFNVLRAAFYAAIRPGEDAGGESTAIAVGFLGLLAVVVVLAAFVLTAMDPDRAPRIRRGLVNTAGSLAIVGAVVAGIFSLMAANAEENDVSGGWGAPVLMVGIAAAWGLLLSRHD